VCCKDGLAITPVLVPLLLLLLARRSCGGNVPDVLPSMARHCERCHGNGADDSATLQIDPWLFWYLFNSRSWKPAPTLKLPWFLLRAILFCAKRLRNIDL